MSHEHATLLLSSGKSFDTVRHSLLNQLLNKEGMSGIYLTFNQPYKQLHKVLREQSINPEQLFVIDAVTLPHGLEQKEGTRVYLERIDAWRKVLDAIEQAVTEQQYTFIFVDSLPLIEAYNAHNQTKEFIKKMLKKNQVWQKKISFFCIPGRETEQLVSFARKHCGNVMSL